MQNTYIPDLTGSNPDYRVKGEITTYYTRGQIFRFPNAVFYDSIKIHPLNGSADWIQGQDFTYEELDNTTTAYAKNQDPTFNKRMVDYIILNGDLSNGQYQITLSYQSYTPTTGDLAINSQDGTVNWTPAVALETLRRLQSQMQKSLLVSATTVPVDVNPKLLDWDKDCINPKNIITDELHTVNTVSGINTIRPTYAPFFRDGLSITAGGRTLIENQDYVLKGLSRSRTAESSNKSGVYNLILFISDYNGDDVKVTYHAVGGIVSMKDMKSLTVGINDIITFLNSTQYLTNEQLPDAPNFAAVLSRITNLEFYMRILLSGSPTYGETSSGTAISQRLRATDANLHWFSIATLYQVPGSSDIIKQSDMKLHIEMPDRHLQTDVSLVVDLNNLNSIFKIKSENFLYDQGFSLYGQTSNVTPPAPLLFRIVYNSDADNSSGCILQLGTSLPGLIERIAIEDRSSLEGCFQLITHSTANAPIDPQDDQIALPDPTRTWTSNSSGSKAVIKALNNDEGYLLFMGARSLSDASVNTVTVQSPLSLNSSIYSWFPVNQIRSVSLYYTIIDPSGVSSKEVIDIPLIDQSGQYSAFYTGQGNVRGNLTIGITNTVVTLFYDNTPPGGNTININYIIGRV